MGDLTKHILRVAGVTAIGIAAAVGADMLWPERSDDQGTSGNAGEQNGQSETVAQ